MLFKLHGPDGVFHPSCSFGCGRVLPMAFGAGHSPVSNFTTAWVQMSYGERN